MEGDRAIVIANAEGSRTTPSVVGFSENGDRLVGRVARRQALTNPEHTIYAVKRLMGRKYSDSHVHSLAVSSPYEIVRASNGDAHVRARGRAYAPPEISAIILNQMRITAEEYLGESVSEAVITVPAYFDESQRQATKDAGRIAGMEVLRIINEPTAAALAYGLAQEGAERVAVYDLGGGTFDISILELSGGVFQVQATAGDTFLGGEDFDNALMAHIIDTFASEQGGFDLRGDKLALQRVKEEAEKAKKELSTAIETEIHLPFLTAIDGVPKHLQMPLTRKQLEGIVEPYVARTQGPCQQALEDAKLKAGDVDVVILVGGQTRMPRIREMVGEFFDKEPHRGVNPDEVVAVGAAVQAGVLTGAIEEVLLLDVTPLSLGVETSGGVFTRLIERNTTVPTRASEVFSTALDNQDFVEVHVLQGERDMAADNKSLATFQLVGIPPAPRGVPRIEVTFSLDVEGILTVSAKEMGTGSEQSVRVVPTGGLTEEDIKRLIDEAEAVAGEDMARRELADARNQVESLLYTAEKALREFGQVLAPIERDRMQTELKDVREFIERAGIEDIGSVRARAAALERATQRIGERIYTEIDTESDGASEQSYGDGATVHASSPGDASPEPPAGGTKR